MNKATMVVSVLVASACAIVAGCGNAPQAAQATDYSQPGHWVALPAAPDKPVDVFFLYATAWKKVDPSEPNLCAIDNPLMLVAAKQALARSGTAFETVGNIYAPYYRQADAVYCTSLPIDRQWEFFGGVPATDATAAFDYYIKHYNKGRPFILAAHSQGSAVTLTLLERYMKEHPDVYRRMIAAYAIGISVTPDYLARNPHLKFAESPDDTGVIISYNTEAPNFQGRNPVLWPGALAINPITWTRGEAPASAAENLGSNVLTPERTFVFQKGYADARVDKGRGVVVCGTPGVDNLYPSNALFPKGVYHSLDYPLYYYNLRQNAANRVAIFLKQRPEFAAPAANAK